jgi:phosphatidylglycerol lysyltransferase
MTGDLMRRRKDAPNGIMDYLFLSLLLHAKQRGYSRVSLGLAPMTGFRADEFPSIEERVIHALFDKLGFLFSFHGPHRYKAKFATSWEPRFLLYQHTLQLPRIGLALRALARVGTTAEPEELCDESLVYGSR